MIGQQIDRGALFRWVACGAAVLCAHPAGAAVVAGWSNPILPADAAGGAIVLDLAPVETAPETPPEEVAPGPTQSQSDPSPASPLQISAEKLAQVRTPDPQPTTEAKPEQRQERDRIEPAPAPDAEVTVPAPQAKPDLVRPDRSRPAAPAIAVPSTSAPRPAAQRDTVAAAPSHGQPAADSAAVSSWKSRVITLLEHNKRYPAEAAARREQGVAQLSFSIDRTGRMVARQIVRSSGSAALDREALALAHRAQPFPPPPSALPGENISLIVPIRFNIR